MKDTELRRIYHQIKNELLTFQNELKKLSVPDYPSEICFKVIDELDKRVDNYEKLLSKIIDDLTPDEQDENIIKECKNKIVTSIHSPLVTQDAKFLNWLSKSQTRKVPWSFVHRIEHLGEKILPEKQVLIYSEDKYNYEVCWARNPGVAPYPYFIISLPLLHRTNILWHTLIGHELFHPRCYEFIDKYNQEILTEIRDAVSEKSKELLPEEGPENLFSETEKKNLIVDVSNVIHFAWRRALEELLSDMACAEIFGPAGLLAMNAFSACSVKNTIPEPANNFYPSWQYRLEIVWKEFIDENILNTLCSSIKNKEIAQSFRSETERIKFLVDKKEGDKLVKSHKHAKIAYSEIDKVLPEAVAFVKSTIPADIGKWYDADTLEHIPDLVERLENGIPPNEIILEIDEKNEKYKTKPATLSGIILAGWIYETYWQEKFQGDNLMPYNTMSRLLLKACEDIETISNICQH